jgi:glycine betaine/proline transport system permease protein
VESLFLSARTGLKLVLDPMTQPLSWFLDGALYIAATVPWWVILPLLLALTWWVSRSIGVFVFVAISFLFLGAIDHLDAALQTLSIIFV